MARGAGVVERPDERRVRVEVARQLGKLDVIGAQSGDDLVADLPHRRVVVAEEARLHFLLARLAVLRAPAHQDDVAADVLAQQLVGLEQVVLVVLLEHVHARRLGERPEVHRRRIHRRRDVHEPQVEAAARQLQIADVAHERDVGVVHGDGQLDLVVERRRVLSRLAGGLRRRNGAVPRDGARCDQYCHKPNSCLHVTAPLMSCP